MGRDLGKPGFMTKKIEFHFSTFSITNIFYDHMPKELCRKQF